MTQSIVVTNDDAYEEAPPIPVRPIAEMTKEEVIGIIRQAGIIGMGGAGFPTHVKLSPQNPAKIHYIIAIVPNVSHTLHRITEG